jgi:IS1 family transposase
MAKVDGGLFSALARGSFDRALIYRNHPRGNVVTRFFVSRDNKQPGQLTRRLFYRQAVDAWNLLTPEQQAEYNNRSHGRVMTGYNLWLREYMQSYARSYDLALYDVAYYDYDLYYPDV